MQTEVSRGWGQCIRENRVRWPQEFVLAGSNKERVSYDQLTPVQWMDGFCLTMKEQQNLAMREFMLDYVINILEGAGDFSLGLAKASYAVLLCRIKQCRLLSG